MLDLEQAIDAAKGQGTQDGLRRRDFLSILGAGFAAIGTSGCYFRAPKETIVPYINQPEDALTGVANWYASTCSGCQARCGVLVKNRDGRPIKLEGNPNHPLSRGGLCARGQATVLDLYDAHRIKGPTAKGKATTWEQADAAIVGALEDIKNRGGAIRLVSSTVSSPTVQYAIEKFIEAYPSAQHVAYDALSHSAILDAHETTHRVRRLPRYHFNKAKVVASFDADFLGTWIDPVQFTRDWAGARSRFDEDRTMPKLVQFEALLTTTGANADQRTPLRPSEQLPVLISLARLVGKKLGIGGVQFPSATALPLAVGGGELDALADALVDARGESLVVCGSRDPHTQRIANALNEWLGNYGNTLDVQMPSYQFQGSDAGFEDLLGEMEAGTVAALIVLDANPAYDHPRATEFRGAMEKVALTVALACNEDETTGLVAFRCPTHHALESWGDAHPVHGVFTMAQPTIAPLYNTRQAVESLMAWTGESVAAYDLMQTVWDEKVFPLMNSYDSFKGSWNRAVQSGVLAINETPLSAPRFEPSSLRGIEVPSDKSDLEVAPYASVALGDGRQANNPWLQELPDPVAKTTWGNVAAMSPHTAAAHSLSEGEVVEISDGLRTVRLPVLVQQGMAHGVVAAALGYGRPNAGTIAANYPIEKMLPVEKELMGGADLFPFLHSRGVTLKSTGKKERLAKTQIYDFQTVPFTNKNRRQIEEMVMGEKAGAHENDRETHPSLWPGHEYNGHKWAMVIDMNRCTGCSACVVGCQAENNVPVVGKAEMRKNREMHWIRLDRYYAGSPDAPEKNPDVSFQPMLCQHCDNAPCETVCPVLATTHSSEGLNMQVYNRCVGTKYCANNCPYKVRRFNWFDYAHDDSVQNLVLNPDVTVRTRGVMEKCTFCVQRINAGKREAKRQGRPLADGDIQPACAQSCPAAAITFGDINDPKSRVAKLAQNERAYEVLDELGTRPAIIYLKKVRNRKA